MNTSNLIIGTRVEIHTGAYAGETGIIDDRWGGTISILLDVPTVTRRAIKSVAWVKVAE